MHRRTVLIQLLGLGVAAASPHALAHPGRRPGVGGWPIASAGREGLPFVPLREPLLAVATAFAERVEGVWWIRGQNLMVLYRLNAEDALAGRTVSRMDHGYGLTVLSLWRHGQPRPWPCPPPASSSRPVINW